MRTISKSYINEIVIKNSKFITLLYPVDSPTKVEALIEESKKLYPKASHYCYAYTLKNYQKSSDDKEPSGTAGIPMLNVLIKENLINILVIVIRYFGGIKLGAGGLLRAYSSSVTEALKKAEIKDCTLGYKVKIKTIYNNLKSLDYTLKDYQITNKSYNEDIIYEVLLPKDKLDIISTYNYQIINEEYIIE